MHALTMTELLRATWPRHTAKEAARAAHSPVATAKAWVQARFTPSADTLLRMAQENEKLRAELLRRLGAYGYGEGLEDGGGLRAAEAGRVSGEAGGLDRSARDVAHLPQEAAGWTQRVAPGVER